MMSSPYVLYKKWLLLGVISIQRYTPAGFKVTKLFGIYDFSAAKDFGKVFIIIGHVLNEQGTGYEHIFFLVRIFSIDCIENGARHLKEHPITSYFTKFDGYWFKRKGMVHF